MATDVEQQWENTMNIVIGHLSKARGDKNISEEDRNRLARIINDFKRIRNRDPQDRDVPGMLQRITGEVKAEEKQEAAEHQQLEHMPQYVNAIARYMDQVVTQAKSGEDQQELSGARGDILRALGMVRTGVSGNQLKSIFKQVAEHINRAANYAILPEMRRLRKLARDFNTLSNLITAEHDFGKVLPELNKIISDLQGEVHEAAEERHEFQGMDIVLKDIYNKTVRLMGFVPGNTREKRELNGVVNDIVGMVGALKHSGTPKKLLQDRFFDAAKHFRRAAKGVSPNEKNRLIEISNHFQIAAKSLAKNPAMALNTLKASLPDLGAEEHLEAREEHGIHDLTGPLGNLANALNNMLQPLQGTDHAKDIKNAMDSVIRLRKDFDIRKAVNQTYWYSVFESVSRVLHHMIKDNDLKDLHGVLGNAEAGIEKLKDIRLEPNSFQLINNILGGSIEYIYAIARGYAQRAVNLEETQRETDKVLFSERDTLGIIKEMHNVVTEEFDRVDTVVRKLIGAKVNELEKVKRDTLIRIAKEIHEESRLVKDIKNRGDRIDKIYRQLIMSLPAVEEHIRKAIFSEARFENDTERANFEKNVKNQIASIGRDVKRMGVGVENLKKLFVVTGTGLERGFKGLREAIISTSQGQFDLSRYGPYFQRLLEIFNAERNTLSAMKRLSEKVMGEDETLLKLIDYKMKHLKKEE